MTRWLALAGIILVLAFSVHPSKQPLSEAWTLVFAGSVIDLDGHPIPGAEVRLLADSGRVRFRAFSDLAGLYKVPAVAASKAPNSPYAIEISHLRYEPQQVKDAVNDAGMQSRLPAQLSPAGMVTAPAGGRIVRRDFRLSPSSRKGAPIAQLNPNLAEYYFREAGLLLSRGKSKDAFEMLKVYVQVGGNRLQVGRALDLLAKMDR